jgi:DNA-binding GntR family transcriptional regulator
MLPIKSDELLMTQVYQRILDAIADGSLLPGMRLRQGELAEQLDVSRQPVSHALHLLHHQGLLTESGRKGFEVAPIDPVQIGQLYQVRGALDGLAARLAAERIRCGTSAGALAMLEAILLEGHAAIDTTVRSDPPTLVRLDVRFHHALYQLSGNPVFETMTCPAWPHLSRSMAAVLMMPNYGARAWGEHEAIVALVRRGDADGAESAARAHARDAGQATARRLGELKQAA